MYFIFEDDTANDPPGLGERFTAHAPAVDGTDETVSTFTLGADSHQTDIAQSSYISALRHLIALSTPKSAMFSAMFKPTNRSIIIPVSRARNARPSTGFSMELFERLPAELRIRIIACLDPKSYFTLTETRYFASIVASLYKENRHHICSLSIEILYPAEHSHPIMRYLTEATHDSKPLLCLTPDVRNEKYREMLEILHGVTEFTANSIQLGMPSIQERHLIRQQLCYIFGLLRHVDERHPGRAVHLARADMFWAVFGKLSESEKQGLENFLDNVYHAFLIANPVKVRTRTSCQHGRDLRCGFTITKRLTDELTALGVFEVVAKQRFLSLLATIYYTYMTMDHPNPTETQLEELEAISHIFEEQVWDPVIEFCAAQVGHGTHQFRVHISLASTFDYTFSIYGSRGDGSIHLQLDPAIDIYRWFCMAMKAEDGVIPSTDDFHEDGRRLLAGIVTRESYWTDWQDLELWGLERLFREVEAPRRVFQLGPRPPMTRRRRTEDELEERFSKLSLA